MRLRSVSFGFFTEIPSLRRTTRLFQTLHEANQIGFLAVTKKQGFPFPRLLSGAITANNLRATAFAFRASVEHMLGKSAAHAVAACFKVMLMLAFFRGADFGHNAIGEEDDD